MDSKYLTPKPIVLIILDGWGYREEQQDNAIAKAHTPNWQRWWQQYPHTTLEGSGNYVGLPEGQMGNSEVGHLNIGMGRVVYQDFTRIEQAISNGEFYHNLVLLNAIQSALKQNKALHVLGLLSPGGVHSHERQIHALIELAAQQGLTKIYVHAFLDGRDTPPQSASASIQALEDKLQALACGRIASIIGRYYAMDRDKRWERVQTAYDLLTLGSAKDHAATAEEALQLAYQRGETDEFVQATKIGKDDCCIEDGDSIVFMNFRADRARALSHALTDRQFDYFPRQKVVNPGAFVTLTQYAANIAAEVAFPPQPLTNGLGETLAKQGLKQLRIAETEKYAHVTFFFNGGVELPFAGEKRLLIPSPKIATYDQQPEMSANLLTDKLIEAVYSQDYDVIICNYANPDMVGHSGNFQATVKAIETIDSCLGRVIYAIQRVGGEAIITADHGNAECMYDAKTKQPHTAHTSEPVPFLYVGRLATIKNPGTLADVAPTLLTLLGLPVPEEMTGSCLLELD